MRTLFIATFVLFLFSLAPTALAGTVGLNGDCTPTGNECISTLSCVSGKCVNPIQGTGSSVTLINPLKGGATLESFLSSILDFVIRIGAIIVVLMLVFVGFKFVMAQGKDSELVEARKMLLWTIIGALILLGAKAIQVAITETVKALSVGG